MIRKYFQKKKQMREMQEKALGYINDILPSIQYLVLVAKELADELVDMTDLANSEDFKGLMSNIDKIANNPELTTDFYKEVGTTVDFQNYLETRKKFEQERGNK